MRQIRWKQYETCFDTVLSCARTEEGFSPVLLSSLKECTHLDPAADRMILGVSSSSIAFLEFLFYRAQGPYSPDFECIADVIRKFFSCFPELQNLINLNGPDTLANMVLNKRGRLKFLISDELELGLILHWWELFGLKPVFPGDVFNAILDKPTIRERLTGGDPLLIIRLSDVFPDKVSIINPQGMKRTELLEKAGKITRPPSERRYHQVLARELHKGRDIWLIIQDEEKRILPMQVKRNRFLAYLVKSVHQNSCQICKVRGVRSGGPTEVHHIIPLSRQGKDSAENMLVTCIPHHSAIHKGEIVIQYGNGGLQVRCPDGTYHIPLNKPESYRNNSGNPMVRS